MKYYFYNFLYLIVFLVSCSQSEINSDASIESDNSTPAVDENNSNVSESTWIVPTADINGSFSPFPLALNPSLKKVQDVGFLKDEALVAVMSFGREIRIYPYNDMSRFESVNDKMDDIKFAMTYCPLTKSALCWDRNYNNEDLVFRASGYLLYENVIAFDEKTDTYWSQMLAKCIKGKYHGENNKTYNFIETTWKTAKDNFSNAKVFTANSVGSTGGLNKMDIGAGEGVYGILNLDYIAGTNKEKEVYFYRYKMFEGGTKILTNRISNKDIIVIGNRDMHFISSYIIDENETYKAVQNQFPIVMEDSAKNKWDVFGVAVEGPKKGQQLVSLTGFVASWWAWQNFYDDYEFGEL